MNASNRPIQLSVEVPPEPGQGLVASGAAKFFQAWNPSTARVQAVCIGANKKQNLRRQACWNRLPVACRPIGIAIALC
jgi:hypothetical protein